MGKNVPRRTSEKMVLQHVYRRIGHRKTSSVLLEHKVELGSGGKKEGEWAGTFTPYKAVESLA